MAVLSFLDRERTIAKPGFSRWLVPPAALSIHLAIGQAYAFSVFNLPLTRVIGVDHSAPGDWKLTTIGWTFSLAIVFLGLSAAVFGRWLERVGPRRAMFTAALCFSGGFFVGAFGVATHQIWLLYLGYGVLGGTGLGIGYISPVSTLIKWFPDRPGMATGLAIMGFGGGAMIASPLSVFLMEHYRSATSVGVAQTFVTLGVLYFLFMMWGVFTVRLPAPGWKPAGYVAPREPRKLVTTANVHVDEAIKTPQFWLLWWVLCLNVTAGIGVLEQASPMIQETFNGTVTATAAAGFVGLLSLFNMGGRFGWSTFSDFIGRKATYTTFFVLGAVIYASVPQSGRVGSVAFFVIGYLIIISMYGGGFATIPAYLKDVFGTMHVGAIHGRILTAWSAAGVFGPVLINYIREYEINHGVPKSESYTVTMYIRAGLLVIGLVCNLLVKPVHPRHHYVPDGTEGELVPGYPNARPTIPVEG
jgi:MFS family permease